MHHIDNNHRTLKRNDDKFYMLSINPSGEEQSHLIEKVTGKKVGEFSELTAGEQEEVLAELKKILPRMHGRICPELLPGENQVR